MKAGYQQTEVGVIPEGWEVKRLGTVIAIRNAKVNTFGADVASFCVELEQVGQNSGQIDGHSDARARQSVKYRFDQGDVLFGRLRPYLRKFWWADREGVCSTEIWPFIPVDGQLTSGFLFQTVQTDTFIQAANSSYGTHMPRADWSALTQFEILVPGDLAEQTAIATALSDVDGLLGGLDRLIAKKRDLKQAAMQQLLTGQTRLPGFHGEWEVKNFGELFNFSGGYSASRDQLSSDGHCYLHYGDIHGATKTTVDVRADFQNIPKLDIPLKRVASRSLLEDGDVVFVDASEDDEGASRHVVVVNKDKKPFISGLHTIVAKSKTDELAHEYRRYCFQTAAIRQQFLFYAVGTKVSGISKTNIAKLKMPVPKVPEQTAIATVLTEMDGELAVLQQRREKTRALKQAMMQELLTGRTRLV